MAKIYGGTAVAFPRCRQRFPVIQAQNGFAFSCRPEEQNSKRDPGRDSQQPMHTTHRGSSIHPLSHVFPSSSLAQADLSWGRLQTSPNGSYFGKNDVPIMRAAASSSQWHTQA